MKTSKSKSRARRLGVALRWLARRSRPTTTLEMARLEGRWAWRAGKPLSEQPYMEEIHGAEAIQWQLGWMELADLDRALDRAPSDQGHASLP